jgi:tetratricopeptide (TPR) repeat protein/tRNA A-37 threonylcarbamoyl transferase component Bud32
MSEAKIGKYTIVSEIGRGAMGIVYKALDPYIGRTVAVKTIRFDILGQGPEREIAQKRFMREAHSAGNLSHPNIVTIYDVGEDQGISYIAMEYVDGSSLDELLHSRQKFSLEEILRLVERVAEGLESAHKKGVVHRDIKPANILIDSEGRPRIVDFGIARISTSTMTQTNMIMGTPYYMSPEQISGRRVDNRADIFALGGILYELLTGQKAFPGENLTTVIYKIINEEPPPVRNFQKNLPEGLDYIVSKALAKDPDERYQTCREMIHDLEHYAELKAPAPAASPGAAGLEAPPARPIVREPRAQPVRTPPRVEARSARVQSVTGAESWVEPAGEAETDHRRRTLIIVLGSLVAAVGLAISLILLWPKGSANSPLTGGGPGGGGGGAASAPASRASTPAGLFAEGRQLWGDQKYTEALAAFERIPESAPEYFDARLFIGSIWEAQGRLGAAASEYRRLIDRDTKDGRPYLHLGQIDERRGDLASALANYRRFVEISPSGVDAEGIRWKIKNLEAQLAPPESSDQGGGATNQPPEAKGGPESKPAGGQSTVQTPPRPPDKPESKPGTKPDLSRAEREADIAQMVEVGKKSVDRKNYAQAVQQLKSVLALDPDNKQAKYYLDVAEKKLEEENRKATVKKNLDQARAALRSQDYGEAVTQARRALALDPGLSEAQKIVNTAVVRGAPAEIAALLDEYVQAVGRSDPRSFYSGRCTPELFQRIKKDAEVITTAYRDLQVRGSGLEVEVTDSRFDRYAATAEFNQVMTGISREKGTRQILFEGRIRWGLVNTGSGWRISEITALPSKRK